MFKKEKKVGGQTLPDFKTYYKTTVIKKDCVGTWPEDTHIDQWSRIESPETNTYIYS